MKTSFGKMCWTFFDYQRDFIKESDGNWTSWRWKLKRDVFKWKTPLNHSMISFFDAKFISSIVSSFLNNTSFFCFWNNTFLSLKTCIYTIISPTNPFYWNHVLYPINNIYPRIAIFVVFVIPLIFNPFSVNSFFLTVFPLLFFLKVVVSKEEQEEQEE